MDDENPYGPEALKELNARLDMGKALDTWRSSRPKMMERIETQEKLLDKAWALICSLGYDSENCCVLCGAVEGDKHDEDCRIVLWYVQLHELQHGKVKTDG